MISLWGEEVPEPMRATPSRTPLVIRPDASLRVSLFSAITMSHPAKQNLRQLIHLLKRFAVPGGLLVDPFGGSGAAMLACSPLYGGMYVVTCELASHFVAMQENAWAHFQSTMLLKNYREDQRGDFMVLRGDSRNLVQVMRDAGAILPTADLIITSPSYGGSEAIDHRKHQNSTIAHHGGGNVAKQGYQQIERMPVPMTPRWGGSHAFGPHSQLSARMANYQDDRADLIVTSPPYDATIGPDRDRGLKAEAKRRADGRVPASTLAKASPNSQVNLGSYDNPAFDDRADLIVTSPPYQDAISDQRNQLERRVKKSDELGGAFRKSIGPHSQVSQVNAYSDTQAENIGNLKGKLYLDSMRLVWQQCALIMKPGAILCCITRDCVRKGKRVPVGDQNRELLEAAGLIWRERETWRLNQMSFWRILHQRENPNAPVIQEEYVDIFQKPEVRA